MKYFIKCLDRRFSVYFFLLIALSTITGCSYIPHDVEIKPSLSVKSENIGNGKTLSVLVQDDRNSKNIGYRTYIKSGKISVSEKQNLVEDIQLAIENGFRTLNFKIVEKDGNKTAKIDIRLIEYESVLGFFTGGAHSRATFKLECITKSGKRFNNIYRIDYEHRFIFLPFKSTNRKWINEAVSDSIMALFTDDSLISFLKENV